MDFVIIANSWEQGLDNPTSKHHVAMELSRAGHRVLWIESAGMRRPDLSSGRDRKRIARKLAAAMRGARSVSTSVVGGSGMIRAAGAEQAAGGIWVVAPLLAPLPAARWARRLNGRLCSRTGRKWAARLGFHDPVLMNFSPVLAGAMEEWRKDANGAGGVPAGKTDLRGELTASSPVRSVYYCVDRWDAFGMYDSAMMSEMDSACCAVADVVFSSSVDLYERCRRLNPNTFLVTHGVDYAHFARALDSPAPGRPADLPPGRIVGFFGLVSEWIDQELLINLARSLRQADEPRATLLRSAPGLSFAGQASDPASLRDELELRRASEQRATSDEQRVTVVLIGKADVPTGRLRKEPNICLLGPRPFADLPAYAAHFDVGIIPFVVNDLTRAVNPIKLREMMAAGCPVVSTALPEVERYADGKRVVAASTREEFISAVERMLEAPPSPSDRMALSASMRAETWNEKVRQFVEILIS